MAIRLLEEEEWNQLSDAAHEQAICIATSKVGKKRKGSKLTGMTSKKIKVATCKVRKKRKSSQFVGTTSKKIKVHTVKFREKPCKFCKFPLFVGESESFCCGKGKNIVKPYLNYHPNWKKYTNERTLERKVGSTIVNLVLPLLE